MTGRNDVYDWSTDALSGLVDDDDEFLGLVLDGPDPETVRVAVREELLGRVAAGLSLVFLILLLTVAVYACTNPGQQ